jgi:hypothetical protein
MLHKFKKSFFTCLLLTVSAANVYGMSGVQSGQVCPPAPVPAKPCVSPFYLRAQFGASWPRCLDLCVDREGIEEIAGGRPRTNLDNKPDKTGFAGFGFGYNYNSLVSFGFSAVHRPHYEFCRDFALESTDNGVTTENRRRLSFDLDNSSLMFDVFINRAGMGSCYSYQFGCGCIAPYLGVGIGLSNNKVSNLYITDRSLQQALPNSTLVLNGFALQKSKKSLSAQFEIGIDGYINECLGFGLGYRYFYSRDVQSGPLLAPSLLNADPAYPEVRLLGQRRAEGKLKANEFVFSMNLSF